MKQRTKGYTRVALLMVGITAVAVIVTAFVGRVGVPRRGKTVVTTTYPLFVAVQNIIGDTDGVSVENLTGTATGCLHDYQLSPANRMMLQQADLLLLSGAGAESFLNDTLSQMPQLHAVDTSARVTLLESCHDHAHPHDAQEQDVAEKHTANEHVWVSPARYRLQVETAVNALCALDENNAHNYRVNGAAYAARIEAVEKRVAAVASAMRGQSCVIFHDSLAYLADDLGLTVAVSLHVGEESGVSASALAAAQQAVENDPDTVLLYDSQYTIRYASIDRLVPSKRVLSIDTAVLGKGSATDWLTAMENNCRLLEGLV